MPTVFEYIEERFYQGLAKREPRENYDDVFEKVIADFEKQHGFSSPYTNYPSFKARLSQKRKDKVCTSCK